jgi:hypothetical protein
MISFFHPFQLPQPRKVLGLGVASDGSWVILKLATVVGSVRPKFLEYASALTNERIAVDARLRDFLFVLGAGGKRVQPA